LQINGHKIQSPPHFFEFKLAHLIQIIVLIGFGFSWWTKHEASSATIVAQNTAAIQQCDQRIVQHAERLKSLEDMRNEVVPDVREIKTKLNIMIELLDGDHKRPELHK